MRLRPEMIVLLIVGCLGCAGCRSKDPTVTPPADAEAESEARAEADAGDSIWNQQGESLLGEGPSEILTDVEEVIGEYIQQPPLTVGSLSDDLPLLTSTPRGVVGIETPPPDEERLVIMPLPFIDATIGAGLGLSVGLVRQPPEGLDRPRLSVLGFGGFASLNGSWGLGVGYRAHTADGEHRVLLGAGLGRMRYDFFGIGTEAGDKADPARFAVQAEYRDYFDPRVGMTVFAGLGEVSPSITQWSSQDLLHSVGIGIRYLVSRKYRSLVRLDFAFVRNGVVVLLGIGEKF